MRLRCLRWPAWEWEGSQCLYYFKGNCYYYYVRKGFWGKRFSRKEPCLCD